jgi:uncharacterized protein
MTNLILRNANENDFNRIIELNSDEVQHTSPMDLKYLQQLNSFAAYHKVMESDGLVVAFLIAMRENSQYQSDNYKWFSLHFERFLYIDRIVVNDNFSGLKIGSLLYKDIFDYAEINRISTITCEYNLIPPNEPSRKFHDKFGFKEVGKQWLANNTKKVSLQAVEI